MPEHADFRVQRFQGVSRMLVSESAAGQSIIIMFHTAESTVRIIMLVRIFQLARRRLTSQSLRDLLVHDNFDVHASFGGGLQHVVKAVFFIAGWWPSEVQLRTKPPVENIYAFTRL